MLRKRAEIVTVRATLYTRDVVERIAHSRCDVLLIDSSVTEEAGFQFVRNIVDTVADLKVIMIGMEENKELFLDAVSAGAAGYVLKDASALEVAASVHRVVEGKAVCPAPLRFSLFRYVSNILAVLPNQPVKSKVELTRRQQQLMPLLAQGLTNKEIASQMNLSEQTVKNHIHRILQKVEAKDRLSVVEMVKANHVIL